MPFEVRHVAAASYANSIYFLSTYPNPGRATVKYSVATDLWLSLNSIPTVRTSTYGGAAAALMVGGTRIYVVGGTDPTASTGYARSESYMVATDTWVTRTSMPTARKALAVAATTTSLFAVGGDVPSSPVALGTLEMLTFATDVWASRKRALTALLPGAGPDVASCRPVSCHPVPFRPVPCLPGAGPHVARRLRPVT